MRRRVCVSVVGQIVLRIRASSRDGIGAGELATDLQRADGVVPQDVEGA
ncbi:hypothetical protein IHQ71_09050 [Rhizobium sp. TH2]|nr:hypothetical protein [Rhizobium sp. TH2]UVC10706.1 hypothetical protein IHQ71_09050 [Rhizobium sp. TH2]